jgi:hypothetical protein
MGFSKRLRYEILRRDNHSCRYCGRAAPAVALTVDHVLPVTLGGTDDPTNLVTACADCNAGKSSTPPDAPMVEMVADDALRWARAIKQAAADLVEQADLRNAMNREFDDLWMEFCSSSMGPWYRPDDWAERLDGFRLRGLPQALILDAFWIAANARHVEHHNRWAYVCGISWKRLRAMEEAAHAILTTEEAEA